MPWKTIGFIIILVLVALFASVNISNKSDISLGFHVFKEVPIFLSLLITFLAGAVVMIPFTFGPSSRKMKAKKEKKAEKEIKGKKKGKKKVEKIETVEVPNEGDNFIEPGP